MFKIDRARVGPALALLALFAIATIGSVWSTSLIKSQQEQKTTASTEEISASNLPIEVADDIIARYTKALAWFTAILAVSTVGLWLATLQTLWHGRKATEREQRAYIGVISGSAQVSGDKFKATLTVSNRGQTPAFDVRGSGSAKCGVNFNPAWEAEYNSFGMSTYLLPNGETKIVVTEPMAKLNDEMAAIAEPATVIISGRLDYRDAFGKDRWITFRCATGPVNAYGVRALSDWENGNDAN